MKSIKIISKSPLGEKALKYEILERLKIPMKLRREYNKQYSFEVFSMIPFSVLLSINSSQTRKYMDKDSFMAALAITLEKNGAIKDVDYSFEVE